MFLKREAADPLSVLSSQLPTEGWLVVLARAGADRILEHTVRSCDTRLSPRELGLNNRSLPGEYDWP